MTWRIQTRHFILPKEGSAAEECEDALAFDARRWATRLAAEWVGAVRAPLTAAEFGPWLKEQGEWLHASWEGRKLPWYAEEKRRAGSYAAFVGLRLEARGRRVDWRAVALGD